MASTLFTKQPLALRRTAVVVFVAIVLMLLDSKNPNWFQPLRNLTHASMQPIYQLATYPTFISQWVGGQLDSKQSLQRENLQLKAELATAKVRLQQQDYLIAENSRLQGILSATRPDNYNLILSQQTIGTDSNPLRQMTVIDKGSDNGVFIGQTVLDEHGVLGQVINVYPKTSRVILLSDEQQSVAVVVKRTGQRAIVSGTGNPQYLSLDYIFKATDVRIGDELISSGLGGRVPAGFPVGRVAKVEDEQAGGYAKILVKPEADLTNTAYVLLLQPKGLS